MHLELFSFFLFNQIAINFGNKQTSFCFFWQQLMNWKLRFNFEFDYKPNQISGAVFPQHLFMCDFPFNFHFVIFHWYTPFLAIFSRKLIFFSDLFPIYCWNIFLHVAAASLNRF